MARYTGPPMDLQNMRSLGVVQVDAYCACGWQASVDVSPRPDELAVPDVRLAYELKHLSVGLRATYILLEEVQKDLRQYNSQTRRP
jgi:hypothetical protein